MESSESPRRIRFTPGMELAEIHARIERAGKATYEQIGKLLVGDPKQPLLLDLDHPLLEDPPPWLRTNVRIIGFLNRQIAGIDENGRHTHPCLFDEATREYSLSFPPTPEVVNILTRILARLSSRRIILRFTFNQAQTPEK